MSFDLSAIPTGAEFMAANPTPPPPTPPTPQDLEAQSITRIQNRLTRFLSQSGNGGQHSITVRTAQITTETMDDLVAQIEAKGYACVMDGHKLTVSAPEV